MARTLSDNGSLCAGAVACGIAVFLGLSGDGDGVSETRGLILLVRRL